MAPADIITLTKACQKLITDLCKDVQGLVKVHDWLEVQAARLNLWANNLGVFAEDDMSIVYRLSKNESVAKIIIQLLGALKGNLDLLRCAILGETPVATAPRRNGDYSDGSSTSTSDDEEDVVSRQQRRIEDGLGRLTQVAVRVRREGAKRSAAKAAEFQPLDEDKEPLAPSFEEHIKVILRRAFGALQDSRPIEAQPVAQPDGPRPSKSEEEKYRIPEYIRERLKRTMSDRWRRISYQRHHAAGLAKAVESKVDVPEPHKAGPKTALLELKPNHDSSKSLGAITKNKQQITTGRAPKTAATETPADLIIDKKADLVPKAPSTMPTTVRAGDLSYPPAPEFKQGTEYFACPLCGLLQSTTLLQRRKWQSHVMQDLSPYICVIKDCRQPYKTFSTTVGWLQHFKDEHSKNAWSCNACLHSADVLFETSDSYERHLKEQHADGGLTAEKISLLIDLGRQQTPPIFSHCLFCGFKPEAWEDKPEGHEFQKEVVDHMCKHHMQTFALDSMPWDIPGADGDSDYRLTRNSQTDSANAMHSILQDEGLTFQDELDEHELKELANDPSLRQYLQARSSAGGTSFNDIKHQAQTASDTRDSLTKLRETVELWKAMVDLEQEVDEPYANQRQRRRTFETDSADTRLAAQQEDKFQTIAAWLSPPDPWTNHQAARQLHEPQTGVWLVQSDQYQNWKVGSTRHLWMYGKPGCGKTILCSVAIEDIKLYCKDQPNVGYAIFYFSFSDKQKQRLTDLLYSVVVQLGSKEPALSMLQQVYNRPNRSMLGLDELENILLLCFQSYDKVFLLIDALDECLEVDSLGECLARLLQEAHNVNLFVTSRELLDVCVSIEILGAEQIAIPAHALEEDIRQYVVKQLERDYRLSQLDPETKALVGKTIPAKSDGGFRYAYCQLQELKRLKSTRPKFVREALYCLPTTLDETYERMLIGIGDVLRPDALTLLQWLAYAKSAPSLDELAEVTIIYLKTDGDVKIEDRSGLEDVLNILSGLVTVVRDKEHDYGSLAIEGAESLSLASSNDEIDLASGYQQISRHTKVKLAHFSIKEYLESKRVLESSARYFYLESETGHGFLAESCLVYLMYYSRSDEKASSVQDLTTFPLLRYAAESWFYHSALYQAGDVAHEIGLLGNQEGLRDWLLVCQPDQTSSKPFKRLEGIGSGLYYASFLGLEVVVLKLLEVGADVHAQGGRYGNALQAASAQGHEKVVQKLLDIGADVNAKGGHYGNALQAASAGGHEKVMQMLIDAGAELIT